MDITSGLPRVNELFEARKPKSPAILAEVSGTVRFKSIVKSKRVVFVEDDFGKEYKHLIPMNKRLLVRDGDRVEAGEALCMGAINPHDILHILGESKLQRYLMDEIQQVYRLQGVSINDKHVGVIVRQMMRKVEIVRVGDTRFIYGQLVDKYRFKEENNRVINEGGQPAVARPVFQGISKASLNIDSFLSAASFQETTRVLTNAAIAGSTDYLRGLKENIIKIAKAVVFYSVVMFIYPQIVSWMTSYTFSLARDSTYSSMSGYFNSTAQAIRDHAIQQQLDNKRGTYGDMAVAQEYNNFFKGIINSRSFTTSDGRSFNYSTVAPAAALRSMLLVAGECLNFADKAKIPGSPFPDFGAILKGLLCALLVLFVGIFALLEYLMAFIEFMFISSVGIILFPLFLSLGRNEIHGGKIYQRYAGVFH
jgi:hypothetical protein